MRELVSWRLVKEFLQFIYLLFIFLFSIGITKEQARVLDMNGEQFVCPPCQSMIV